MALEHVITTDSLLRSQSSLVPTNACNQVFVQAQLGLASGHLALLTHKTDVL